MKVEELNGGKNETRDVVKAFDDAVGGFTETFGMFGDLGALFGALSKAQAEYGEVKRTDEVKVQSDRGSYTFQYAPLENILAACLPALNRAGLYFCQPLYKRGDSYVLETILGHSSGAYMRAAIVVPPPRDTGRGNPIQALGSAITYLRRYSAQSVLGVSAEDDDDGNAADGNHIADRTRNNRQPPKPPTAAKPQAPREAPKASPPPKPATKSEPPPEPKPEPARAKSTPPPPIEDPRQLHVPGADIDRETIPTGDKSMMKDPVELKDGTWVDRAIPVQDETIKAMKLIRENLGISTEVAKKLALEVTGHMASDVVKCDGMAKALLHYFQDIANGDKALPDWVGAQ